MSPAAASRPLLEVTDLSVTLFTQSVTVQPVRAGSYVVGQGRTLAIVGESGSGKTVLNLAPLGLMPVGTSVDLEGSVRLDGRELIGLDERAMRDVRGLEIGIVFQDPLSALNPARRIGPQIAEMVERRAGSASSAERRTVELLSLVGIPDAASRLEQYPHQLSGGMRQRAMIAIAIAAEPRLLIADEPTTALDVTVQAQIVELLGSLQRRLGMAIVLITHDIGVVARMADDVAIMYAGRIVERGTAEEVLTRPRHPYTRGLLRSIPDPAAPVGAPFLGLPGLPPDLIRRVPGCSFAPRCGEAVAACHTDLPRLEPAEAASSTHHAACPVAVRATAGEADGR
jgi:peptide/nickel transport system ATP-binding protein